MSLEIYNKILRSIKNNIDNEKIIINTFKKYSELQGLLNFDYKNILLLATLSNKLNIDLKDVKSFRDWTKHTDTQVYTNKNKLYIYDYQYLDNELFLVQEPVFDITQTNAELLGIRPSNEILNKTDFETLEIILQEIVNNAQKNMGYQIDLYDEKKQYSPLQKLISVDYEEKIESKIAYIISRLAHENIYGENLRLNNEKYESKFSEEENEIELITFSIMSRLGLEYYDDFDPQLVRKDLEETFQIIESGIKSTIKTLSINQLIKNENLKDEIDIERIKVKPKKKFVQLEQVPDEELKKLRKATYDSIITADPGAILEKICSNVSWKTNRYEFSIRTENTPSCSMKLIDGTWKWKDFGGGEDAQGNILKLIELQNNLDWKEARVYAIENLSHLGVKDLAEEAIFQQNLYNTMLKKEVLGEEYNASEDIEKIREARNLKIQKILLEAEESLKNRVDENVRIEKEQTYRTVVSYVTKNIPQKYLKLMEKRGILEIPENMYYIEGAAYKRESENDDSIWIKDSFTPRGIGVLTTLPEDIEYLDKILEQIEKTGSWVNDQPISSKPLIGADVHFEEYTDKNKKTRKTTSFGVGGISRFKSNENSKKLAIFESKMDWAAAAEKYKFKENGINCILANSVANDSKLIELIKKENYDEFIHFNQYDLSGIKFQIRLIMNTKNDFKYFEYYSNEYKEDINDLTKKSIILDERIRNGNITSFVPQINQIQNYLDNIGELTEDKKIEIQKIKDTIHEFNVAFESLEQAKEDIEKTVIKTKVETNYVPDFFK